MQQFDLRKNGERIATMKSHGPKQAASLWMQQKLLEDYFEEDDIIYWDDDNGNHFEVVPESLW